MSFFAGISDVFVGSLGLNSLEFYVRPRDASAEDAAADASTAMGETGLSFFRSTGNFRDTNGFEDTGWGSTAS